MAYSQKQVLMNRAQWDRSEREVREVFPPREDHRAEM